jgi:predicted metal-dependent HD superfamily phosphohydrolase
MNTLQKVKKYCTDILESSTCEKLSYHNFSHTRRVVENAQKIIQYQQVSDNDAELIIISAWFHDVGFCEAYYRHEDESIRLAHAKLKDLCYDPNKIIKVLNCIKATKMPQSPTNVLGEMLCDSDLHHLGSTNFFYYNKLLRTEWAKECNKTFSDLEWYRLNIDFLDNHTYFTQYGQQELEKTKQINLQKLNNMVNSIQ